MWNIIIHVFGTSTDGLRPSPDRIQACFTQSPILRYFYVNEDVIVSVDASSEGLGACLLQENQPVTYASRSLNSTERNYAQIEKEMLAIVFGTSKFHQYIYGKTFMVESDHKPLEGLLKKPLSMASSAFSE